MALHSRSFRYWQISLITGLILGDSLIPGAQTAAPLQLLFDVRGGARRRVLHVSAYFRSRSVRRPGLSRSSCLLWVLRTINGIRARQAACLSRTDK